MAADTQVSDTLKKFALKVTTASVKERREILHELKGCVTGKELPEPAVKGLCKLFCLTLHRYRSGKASPVLYSLENIQSQIGGDVFCQCGFVRMDLSFLLSSKGTSSAASLALSWTFLLVQTVYPSPDKREGATWKKLVEVQSLLLSDVLGGTNKHNLEGIVKKLRQIWKENPGLADQYLSVILSLEQSHTHLGMLGVLVDFCTAHKDMATVNKHKSALLDLYMKTVLMSKTKPPRHVLLKANNPQVMDEAVLALQTLALQCSDPSAVESLSKHLFAILGGIGSLSQHSVSGSSSQALSSTVAELFIPFLQQEVHEGTLVHAVSVLTLWSSEFTTEVPTKLVEWLKKAFTLKTSTSAVRHAYLQCLLACFRGDTLLQGVELLPLLIQTVEKASFHQGAGLLFTREQSYWETLVLDHAFLFSPAEAKLSGFWQLVLDEKKQIFTAEKFLSLASEEALCTVLQLAERLLLDHPHRLPDHKAQMYHRALVLVLLTRTWRVRKQAQHTVRKLLAALGGVRLAYGMLEELRAVLDSHKVLPLDALVTEAGELSELGRSYTPPRILLEALCVITSVRF
ncbi:UNVERIFIED_CONTAM: hypothetical protein FKN15_077594 [Acipenser sinensis]